MADKREKKPTYVTPKGTAKFPYLNKPDFKFKPDYGEYKTALILSAADAAPYIKMADDSLAEALADPKFVAAIKARAVENKALKAKNKDELGKVPQNLPYTMLTDEESGEETGEVEFKFSTAAGGKNKKSDEVWTRKLKLFDAKKKPVTENIWSGTQMKVAFSVGPYFINAKVGGGSKFYLEAVQVIDLVSGGDGKTADGYGFGEEDGYESSGETAGDDTAGDAGGTDDAPDF